MKNIVLYSMIPIVLVIFGAFHLKQALQVPSLPEPPLKELTDHHGLQIGTYAAYDRIGNRAYDKILTSQFEFAIVDGDLNWAFVNGTLRPSRDEFDFSVPDEVFAYAEKRGLSIQAHHFVWGEKKWIPKWLQDGNYSKEELLQIMEEHIKTVGAHYRGRVERWTVVNEHFTRKTRQNGLDEWWYERIGDEYVDKAFVWAREADPNATLILNDFFNEYLDKYGVSDMMYNYIRDAKARGVPIDGLGMQMHIDGTAPPTKDEVVANMRRFGELGIKVYVTEFDVNMNDVPGSEEEKRQKQATIYSDMLRACIESDVCPAFGYLGITDNKTWYNELGVPNAMPLPFDRDYNPKPAFFAIREALEQP